MNNLKLSTSHRFDSEIKNNDINLLRLSKKRTIDEINIKELEEKFKKISIK